MRSCKADLAWKKVENKKSNNNFISINFNNFHGIDKILSFPNNGIIAFCGLNGVGKSTILTIVKKIIGLKLNESEKNKIDSTDIYAVFNFNNKTINPHTNNNTLKDCGVDLTSFAFLNFETINEYQNKFVIEANLNELIEQNEQNNFSDKDINEINILIGKKYNSISCVEIEFDDDCIIPFFIVTEEKCKYDSITMGKGEYYILYLFWNLNKLSKNSTIILDEPENGISIASQKHLMNFLASFIEKKEANLIITTHSPFILERIPLECLRIIVSEKAKTNIIMPKSISSINKYLDIDIQYEGVFLVEDKTAKDFLYYLLELYNPHLLSKFMISIAEGGDTYIKDVLESLGKIDEYPLKFIGVFDGDDRDNDIFNSLDNSCFLPGKSSFEEIFEEFIDDEDNRKAVSKNLKINYDDFLLSISKHKSEDYHDYFINLFNDMHLHGLDFIHAYCDLAPESVLQEFESFVAKLSHIVNQ